MIRLRGKTLEVLGAKQPEPSQANTPAGLLQHRLSKRQFLKGLTVGAGATGVAGTEAVGAAAPRLWKLLAAGAGVVGIAGAGHLAAPPRSVFAENLIDDDLRVTGKLTVQGAAASSCAGNLGIGTTGPGTQLEIYHATGSVARVNVADSSVGGTSAGLQLLEGGEGVSSSNTTPSITGLELEAESA